MFLVLCNKVSIETHARIFYLFHSIIGKIPVLATEYKNLWRKKMAQKINKYSARLTEVESQVGSQAMLYGVGLSDEDMEKAQIGITSLGWDGNPCNMHLNELAGHVKEGVIDSGMVGLIFHTIGVSDGIAMGTEGMKYSLPSRDIIADSIETVMRAQWYDANIAIPGCDKNMPGTIMAMARLNRPGIMIYGGTIRPGWLDGRKLDIVSAFGSYGESRQTPWHQPLRPWE